MKELRTIAVVVSIGDKVLSVPQLVGSPSQRQAELILEQNGLSVGHTAVLPDAETAQSVGAVLSSQFSVLSKSRRTLGFSEN